MHLITAEDAAQMIGDGATVLIGGVVSMVTPEAVLRALGQRFAREQAPTGLTIICPNRTGWVDGDLPHGVEHLAQAGLVEHVITSTFSAAVSPNFMQQVMARQVAASVVPMGVLFRWLRECTARSPGLLTDVGLGTFFDPAVGARTPQDAGSPVTARSDRVARRVRIGERDLIFMPSMDIDVALIRGSVADTEGNISLEDEPVNGGALQMAMAARNSGGRVIAVVKALTEHGTLHPRMVQVPGIFVDHVVLDRNAIQSQAGNDDSFTGRVRTPGLCLPPMALGCQKVILRRAAMELRRGDIVNLGFGMGTQLPALAAEEGFLQDLRFSVEHGAIGGTPSAGGAFGAHHNPSAIIDPTDLFDFYHGGGLDATILGFAEVDADGNVNVGGGYTGALRGPGGFVDIVHRTRKVLICGTLTSGGLEVGFTPDGLAIVNEGRHRKFKARVDHIDLCGPQAVRRGQQVLVITERCVFEVGPRGLVLVEVAPGIDPKRHIAPWVDFELRCDRPPRAMPGTIFGKAPAGIRLRAPGERRETAP